MTIRKRFRKRRAELSAQIADRCRQRRKELGYTQQVAALMAGVGSKSVQRIEDRSGDTLPSLDALGRYADALGISLTELFADDDPVS